jgi:GNAT superfamily N-acetyltransferase
MLKEDIIEGEELESNMLYEFNKKRSFGGDGNVFIASINEEKVGWGFLYEYDKYQLQIYVLPQYRRRGVGRKIVEVANTISEDYEVFSDTLNHGFYDKMNIERERMICI